MVRLSTPYDKGVELDYYCCIVHPSVEADIREMVARDAWRYSFRAARRAGFGALDPKVILEKFHSERHAGEIGRSLGFKYIGRHA